MSTKAPAKWVLTFIWQLRDLLDKKVLPLSVLTTALILLPYNPAFNINPTSFTRIIGLGLFHNIDITKLISHFYFLFLVAIPTVFMLCWLFFSRILRSFLQSDDEQFKHAMSLLNTIATVSIMPLLLTYMNLLNMNIIPADKIVWSYAFICFMVIVTLLYIFTKKFLRVPFQTIKWATCISIVVTFLPYSILPFGDTPSIWVYLSLFAATFIMSVAFACFIGRRDQNMDRLLRLQAACVPLAFGPGLVSLFIEITHILNQHGVMLSHLRICSVVIYTSLGILSLLLFWRAQRKQHVPISWERIFYPAMLVSMALILVQPASQTAFYTDLFESANHGLAIDGFFRYGKIPIIETFDAHMLSTTLGGILYGFLNNDFFGAIFQTYSQYIVPRQIYVYILPILYLFFYLLLRKQFSADFSVLIILFMPISLNNYVLSFGFLSVLVLIYAIRRNAFGAYILFFCSLAAVCLYKLDVGFAYCAGTLLTLVGYYLVTKKQLSWKRILLAFATILFGAAAIYITNCTIKHIDPIDRFREFLAIANSNHNWTYGTLGDSGHFGYFFCYFFMPITVLSLLGTTIYQYVNKKILIAQPVGIILAALSIAYFMNISRGMVRHTLLEGTVTILSSSILLIALFCTVIWNKQKHVMFTVILICAILTATTVKTTQIPTNQALFDQYVMASENYDRYSTLKIEKQPRIILSDTFQQGFQGAVDALNTIIGPDETYLDFTNQTLLYALTGKEKPVYVNQSPGLLSGDYSQDQFIREIEDLKDRVLYALLPADPSIPLSASLDGIHNSYRYYKVSEYISKEFRPFCTFTNYALWVRKDHYSELDERLNQQNTTSNLFQRCDYTYGNATNMHDYNTGLIPYLWGTFDEKKAYNNFIILNALDVQGQTGTINAEAIDRSHGNYIMIRTATPVTGTAKLSLGSHKTGTFLPTANFNFSLMGSGKEETYLIRVSSDFFWYTDALDGFTIESDTPLNNLQVHLLLGD